jgi:TolB-like protein/DNA-binding winged helix-turn-helix (wHTH) protein/Flp pilus assembly protein TadD
MDVPFREKGIYRFDRFKLDPLRRTLSRGDARIALQGRPFDTLAYLVQHNDRVVTRTELFAAIWPDRVVEENNLGQAIAAVRRALQDHAAEELILTVAGRGYSIGVPVAFEPYELTASDNSATFALALAETATATPPSAAEGATGSRFAVISVLVFTAIMAATALLWYRAGQAPPFVPPAHSVAVLAFTNLSGDAKQDYLSDGLADELIDRLGRIGALHVVGHASTFIFKHGSATATEIARRLNVAAVLEGTMRLDEKRSHVTVQLIDGATGYVTWTHDYDAPANGSAGLANEIAASVTTALHIPLAAGDNAQLALGGTTDASALDAYLRGMQLRIGGDPAKLEAALAAFQTAVARDPAYALAYVQLAKTLLSQTQWEPERDEAWKNEKTALAVANVRKAIALAPQLGTAHSQLANLLVDFDLDRDLTGALNEAERALLLAPGDSQVLQDVSYVLSAVGHQAQAEAAASTAAALDPLSPVAYRQLALTLLFGRKFVEAEAAERHALQSEPAETEYDRYLLARIALGLGHPAEVLRLAPRISGFVGQYVLAIAEHQLGHDADAERALAALRKLTNDDAPLRYAEVYAQWGRTQDALAWLRLAASNHDHALLLLKEDYALDPIATTADYKAIERQQNFPP